MAKASLISIGRGITDQLEGMVKRANLLPGYLNRVVYREYQNAQRARFNSENVGEDFDGGQWASVDPDYETWKEAKYGDNPVGKGKKINIATGRLFMGLVGPSEDHRKLVDEKSITITHSVEYGRYVDEKRTFSSWSDKFYNRLYAGTADYLIKNIIRGGA